MTTTVKRHALVPVLLALLHMGSYAQTPEQFSVATLNIDGLPQKVLVMKVNADGPGAAGTARIGKYLVQKGYDLVCTQEDFNYHDVLLTWMEDYYANDEWSGDVGIDGHSIDLLHLQNHQFECDGLVSFWKKGIEVASVVRTPWKAAFGKFSHANDEMIAKGFRHYELALPNGLQLQVYNMHMDASDDEDEAIGNDTKDKEARMAQWCQLRDDILGHIDDRPIIVVGDMNSLYGRDDVKTQFIDAINATGLATVSDVWVELLNAGEYPADRDASVEQGETLDKILYINPANGTSIKATSYSIDKDGYTYNGMPLGDHYPVVATFEMERKSTTDISDVPRSSFNVERYNLQGQRISQPSRGISIEHQGAVVVKKLNK